MRGSAPASVRDAGERDVRAIMEIYNDAVLHSSAIWNETTVDAANRAAWIAGRRGAGYPVLVAVEESGAVLGYGSFRDWRAFEGYRHTVEHSLYVAKDRRGAGVGEALLIELIERARLAGKHVMVAAIDANNEASIRLHQKLGFAQVGFLKEVGAKFGLWLDLALFQLTLDSRAASGERGEIAGGGPT